MKNNFIGVILEKIYRLFARPGIDQFANPVASVVYERAPEQVKAQVERLSLGTQAPAGRLNKIIVRGSTDTNLQIAAAFAGRMKRPLYRVDLSKLISKYIGETEKNLSLLLNAAETKDWILFFDEADALFGKRTNIQDAHDKYANQEIAYFEQRLERFKGIAFFNCITNDCRGWKAAGWQPFPG